MAMRQIRELSLKVLGLYYLSNAVISLPQILGIFGLSGEESAHITNRTFYVLALTLPTAIHFAIAYLLLLQTNVVLARLWPKDDECEANVSTASATGTWVSLIGLFYLIGSIGGVTSGLWVFCTRREMMGSLLSSQLLPELVTIALAVTCIVKSRWIAEFLLKKTDF